MAGAYLNGLQQSGKVLGTIKHFPGGLADTSTDPHLHLPSLARSLNDLNSIDWAPYKSLISKGKVYSVMVTHELVKALDPNVPSSLSPKVVSVLRNQLGFQGVILTDGLTMGGILNFYTLGQAAVMAVEAGDDLMMDPGSPSEVAQMVDGLKQAISSGAISQQRINDSVERILLFKYQMGLLNIHP
jgi:beta-N-acetylhexosaminidase